MHADRHNPEAGNNESYETLYGRRVEVDRSWTVYNVFTGIPADTRYGAMTALSHADATDKMIFLNRRSDVRRRTRSSPGASAPPV